MKWLISILVLVFASNVLAKDNTDKISIVLNDIPTNKICIYESSIYTEGAELKLGDGRVFRCERKTDYVNNKQTAEDLHWAPKK